VANEYSATWFDLFVDTIDPAQTLREVEFLARQLPLAQGFRRVLDVCCGTGRHAISLAERGYEVTGIDVNEAALARARERAGASGLSHLRLLRHDMREIGRLDGAFDAAMILWQSFGQFDDATNRDVLQQIAGKLRPAGRFVLDVYHRGFFEPRLGTRVHEKLGRAITETKHMSGPRLTVELDYGDGTRADRYEWHVFTPDELERLCASVGMRCVLRCTEYDEARPPSPERSRAQFVFERTES